MRRTWTSQEQQCFFNSGHRMRYIHSDGLSCIPDNDTPLYAIQHTSQPRGNTFVTTPPSLVIYATSSAFYLTCTAYLKHLVGLQPNSDHILKTTPALWDDSSSISSIHSREFEKLSITDTEDPISVHKTLVQGRVSAFYIQRPRSPISYSPRIQARRRYELGDASSVGHGGNQQLPRSIKRRAMGL